MQDHRLPRERLIAILTNSLMPCNGRFPLLLTMIALLGAGGGVWAGLPMENPVLSSLLTALVLTLFILAAILGHPWGLIPVIQDSF